MRDKLSSKQERVYEINEMNKKLDTITNVTRTLRKYQYGQILWRYYYHYYYYHY